MLKKLTTLFLTFALTATSVSAASRNTLSRGPLTVRDESSLAFCSLQIEPLNEVETGSSIFIRLTNATVFEQDIIDGTSTNKDDYGYNGKGYQWGWNRSQGFYDIVPDTYTAQMPYQIRRLNDHEYEIYLINIPDIYVNNSLSSVNGVSRTPYYSIPIPAYADGIGKITMNIDSNGTSISDTLLDSFEIYEEGGNKNNNSSSSVTSTETTTESDTEITTAANSDKNNTTPNKSTLTVKVQIGSDTMNVNGNVIALDVPAYIQVSTSSTLMPLRAVSEAFGSSESVEWMADTKTAIIHYNNNTIEFTANGDNYVVNGKTIPMPNRIRAEITNGRMFVPLRVLAESMGLNVDWEANTKTAVFSN